MSLSSSPSVTLIIKAPNQKIADQKIECTVDWTVQKLKQHLAKVYPTNPMESQQRIIYSGKLLLDNHQLQDVLKQYEPDQNVHTVHLVCMASMSDVSQLVVVPSSAANLQNVAEDVLSSEGLRRRQPATDASSSSSSSPSSQFVGPELNSSSPPPRAFLPTVNYQPYVPHPAMMYYGAAAAATPPPPSPVMPSFVPGFMPTYGAEQLQWMQQAYAQSMMHYMQQFQQATVQPPHHLAGHAPPVMPAIPVPLANQNFPHELPAGGAAAAAMADAADAPPLQAMRMNAQGGRDMDDEDGERGNRDWLDSTYVFVRFLMLMSILYFYSTPQRFIMMLTLALFAYMGRAGWLRRGRRENRNVEQQRQGAPAPPAAPAPPQQTPHPNPPQPQQQDDALRQENDDTPSPEDVDEEMTTATTNMVDLQATHRLSTFEVIWSVITSFFTSLIPENPPPININ